MSLTETTLTDFTSNTEREPQSDAEPSVDGELSGDTPAEKPAWSPQPDSDDPEDNRCKGCGSFVTTEFARVFGNNHDEVFGCLECMTGTEVKQGGARARDVDTTKGIVGGGIHGSF